jgi:hypothetical protein
MPELKQLTLPQVIAFICQLIIGIKLALPQEFQ